MNGMVMGFAVIRFGYQSTHPLHRCVTRKKKKKQQMNAQISGSTNHCLSLSPFFSKTNKKECLLLKKIILIIQ